MRIQPRNGCKQPQPERLNAQLATAVVPANPGPVMDFYYGDASVEDVSFSCYPLASLPFPFKAAPFAKFPSPACLFLCHSGCKTLVLLLPMVHATTRPATSSTAQRSTSEWFKIDQIGMESDGTLVPTGCSVYHSLRSSNLFRPFSPATRRIS
jgi:hypothetical protein